MTTATSSDQRTFLELLPKFLLRRRRGWTGLTAHVETTGVAASGLLLLRAMIHECDPGVAQTHAELMANILNPYSTVRPILGQLPTLVERGFVDHNDGSYRVTAAGHALIAQIEAESRAYVAAQLPADAHETHDLLAALAPVAEAMWHAPEPRFKPHQARGRRLPAPAGSPPLVQLEDVIFNLWMARDDAHNAAWRDAGFDGPTFDLLSRVWAGEANTITDLIEKTKDNQRPEDVAAGVETLVTQGYIERNGNIVRLTPHGQQTRDVVEAETDRIYFAPWPADTQTKLQILAAKLQHVIDGFPM